MHVTIWKVKFGVRLRVGAYLVQKCVSLVLGQQAHASSREEKDWSVFDDIIGYDLPCFLEEVFEVVWADKIRFLTKC